MIHIIDDNEEVLNVMTELIMFFGFRAKAFISAREYMDYAESDAYRPPAAVISDVMMPDIDGFRLMQRVRAMHQDVRFIIMSGEDHAVTEDKTDACILPAQTRPLRCSGVNLSTPEAMLGMRAIESIMRFAGR